MKTPGNTKNLIIIGSILIVLALAGYFYFNRDQSTDVALMVSGPSASTTVDSTLLNALRVLEKIKLDRSIFSNPRLLLLHDFSKTLVPEVPFRQNPFAPLDSSATSSVSVR